MQKNSRDQGGGGRRMQSDSADGRKKTSTATVVRDNGKKVVGREFRRLCVGGRSHAGGKGGCRIGGGGPMS